MKKTRLIYWSVMLVISFFMLFSAYMSGTRVADFAHLGFPEYFRIELTTAKIMGAVLLLVPLVPGRVKEWIFVCFSVVLVSAAIAKINSGYPAPDAIEPLFVLGIMSAITSYLYKKNQGFDFPKEEKLIT